MEVEAADKKIQKILENQSKLCIKYGADMAKKILQRIAELKAAENLEVVCKFKHLGCHQLQGDRKGQWAITLKNNYRMILIEATGRLSYLQDGSIDLTRITAVTIKELCTDYH